MDSEDDYEYGNRERKQWREYTKKGIRDLYKKAKLKFFFFISLSMSNNNDNFNKGNEKRKEKNHDNIFNSGKYNKSNGDDNTC